MTARGTCPPPLLSGQGYSPSGSRKGCAILGMCVGEPAGGESWQAGVPLGPVMPTVVPICGCVGCLMCRNANVG